ncbi:uncharacterized protein VTP21DRAFT_5650 [Calcarisporiella thermophila]|uniref:uncharacterized protein n=1 Tax=Calcarisporiella thermophila TaxID=911321 RepID=UPI003742A35C
MSEGEISLHDHAGLGLVASQYSDESQGIFCVTPALDAIIDDSDEDTDPYSIFFTPDAIRFQLRLNSLTDLHRLLSAQFVIEGKSLPNLSFNLQVPDYIGSNRPIRRCTYFRVGQIPKPIEYKDIIWTKRPTINDQRLTDYLFHTYISGCVTDKLIPNPACFLESYYNNELEPAFVHSAIALAAIHLLLAHPLSSLKKQLQSAAGCLLSKAKQSLEDAFDTPSLQIVATFINFNSCMTWLSRFEEAYRFHSKAVLMAVALQMDRDNPNVRDPVEIEIRRRIWAYICYCELDYRFGYGKPELISLDIIIRSPKPTVTLDDADFYKLTLLFFMLSIQLNVKLLELRDIDWSLPDDLIIQQLVNIAAFLQSDHVETLQYCGENILRKFHLSGLRCNFWSDWCNLWRQFIKSDAPPGRLETNLMKQMREKALEEFLKGLSNSITLIKGVIRSQSWCYNYPFSSVHKICENSKFIIHVHPDINIRRKAFRELVQVLELLKSLDNKGVIEQWSISQIINTLEDVQSVVYSREELKAIRPPKLRRIAIRPNNIMNDIFDSFPFSQMPDSQAFSKLDEECITERALHEVSS